MDGKSAGIKGGQASDRKRGEGMKREEEKRRSEQRSAELF